MKVWSITLIALAGVVLWAALAGEARADRNGDNIIIIGGGGLAGGVGQAGGCCCGGNAPMGQPGAGGQAQVPGNIGAIGSHPGPGGKHGKGSHHGPGGKHGKGGQHGLGGKHGQGLIQPSIGGGFDGLPRHGAANIGHFGGRGRGMHP